jgi:hypothetical protein
LGAIFTDIIDNINAITKTNADRKTNPAEVEAVLLKIVIIG